jgi:hypothetical protein
MFGHFEVLQCKYEIQSMRCPVCDASYRDQTHECQVEASATIKQRSQFALRLSPSVQDPLDEVILKSRKRQARLASELQQHRASDHKTSVKNPEAKRAADAG